MSNTESQSSNVEAEVRSETTKEFETNLHVGESGRVTIPDYLRDEYGIEVGDRIDAAFFFEADEEGDA